MTNEIMKQASQRQIYFYLILKQQDIAANPSQNV